MKRSFVILLSVLALMLLAGAVTAQLVDDTERRGRGERGRAAHTLLPDAVAAQPDLSLVLGRPTDNTVTLSILSAVEREAFVEYGVAPGLYDHRKEPVTVEGGGPVETLLSGLQPDTRYYYRLWTRLANEPEFAATQEFSFHTRRASGSTFCFAIQGDSHPERAHEHDPALYAQTLAAVAADGPDFYLTIGDDFGLQTLQTVTPAAIERIYLNQRWFLGLVGRVAPVFLTQGNHEQVAARSLDGTPQSVPALALTTRNRYFPQPAPNGFYSGNAESVEHIGLLRNYCAWTWGDALFVVLDPYWHSVESAGSRGERPARDMWGMTLGDAQYHWLRRTLEDSDATYKFVFAHHVLGTGRGGIEMAHLYEWGGHNRRGVWEFDARRPGWPLPIHQLMAHNGVTIFFQGHDHVFVLQELDGVVYQTLPHPANPNYVLYHDDAYLTGERFPGSGYVRVSVAPDQVTVEYVRQYLPRDETPERRSGEIAFSYSVPAVRP